MHFVLIVPIFNYLSIFISIVWFVHFTNCPLRSLVITNETKLHSLGDIQNTTVLKVVLMGMIRVRTKVNNLDCLRGIFKTIVCLFSTIFFPCFSWVQIPVSARNVSKISRGNTDPNNEFRPVAKERYKERFWGTWLAVSYNSRIVRRNTKKWDVSLFK